MARYIDADALYERTAEWEASALAYIEKLNQKPFAEMNEDELANCRMWTAILGERSAFKHDVADAPTADVVEVVRCKDCRHRKFEDGSYICDLDTWDFHELGRNAEDDNWFCADGETVNNRQSRRKKEKTEYEEQQGKAGREEGSGDPEA